MIIKKILYIWHHHIVLNPEQHQHYRTSLNTPIGSMQNLRVIFYQRINMYEYVTLVCRAACYHLKDIHCLKTFLKQETLVTLVYVFVIYRIYYCNLLLSGIQNYNTIRLLSFTNNF